MSEYPAELELTIDNMAQGGAGVGRWQGRVIFAAGALPGERVRVALQQRKKRFAQGVVTAVLEPAPERVAPRLPGADHMPWQHIDYLAQARFKHQIVREQLAKLANLPNPPVAETLPAPRPWSYRNVAHLHVSKEQDRTGYYATGSHTIQDRAADPLLLPALNEALAGLRLLLDPVRWQVQALTLRGSAAHGYAVARLTGRGDLTTLARHWRATVPTLAGVATADTPPTADPPVTLHETLGDVVFSLAVESFFQTHTAQAETLLAVVREALALQPHDTLLDAYSGVGTFALPLAREARQVVAIEEHQQAVYDGERSAHLNAIDNVRFIAAPVEQALGSLPGPVAAAILDPPRRGCHPEALQALLALAPARIVYVSCHPGILARDLQPLLAGGYRLQWVQPVDMFPQTPHIESVALLVRA